MSSCTLDCTSFFAKALLCQNVNHFNIPTSIPTIGLDPILDTCLCVQTNVAAMHSCASCRATNNITNGDGTWVFLNACNQEFPDRHLYLSAAGPGLRPWRFNQAMRPAGKRMLRRLLLDATNVYSMFLAISVVVSTCSVILTA